MSAQIRPVVVADADFVQLHHLPAREVGMGIGQGQDALLQVGPSIGAGGCAFFLAVFEALQIGLARHLLSYPPVADGHDVGDEPGHIVEHGQYEDDLQRLHARQLVQQ